MKAVWGSYQFPDNTVYVATRQRAVVNAAKIPYMEEFEIDCEGKVFGSGQAQLTAAENQLRAALAVPRQNFFFLQDSGAPSAVYILNAATVGGTYVVRGPDFTGRDGSEYANQRNFSFTVGFKLPVADPANTLMEYQETLEYSGGEPVYAFKPAVNGPPQLQRVWYQVPYRVVQTGYAVGFRAYPTPPPPVGPRTQPPVHRKTSPGREGVGNVGWRIDWQYVCESGGPIVALPHLWR
jgi:hypothetical protein